MNDQKRKTNFLENSQKVFNGIRFDVHAIELEGTSGKPLQREAVVHPGAVVILPIVDPKNIVLIRNERFAVDEILWELPAGTLEPNEPPEVTAKRELLEETGYECQHLTAMPPFYTTPGYCTEIMYAYVATGLSFRGQELEDSEKIEVEILHWKDVLQLIKSGEIRDGKTIATLLYYKAFLD